MIVLRTRNVHCALPAALQLLYTYGVNRESRNGPVLQAPEPVATVYSNPCERVMFHPWRDANPFFHFYESLWMLAGRRDIAPLTRYAKQLAQYSDDGLTQNAAYGFRWRQMPTYTQYDAKGYETGLEPRDQLKMIADNLRKNKESRQEVLQIWDHELDLGTVTKDHACNLTATFQIGLDGRLNMVVFCRSNDIVWGCYGANAVHFSMLLEYMACRVGVAVGTYTQISVNWHGYVSTIQPIMEFKSTEEQICEYEIGSFYPHPISTYPPEMMDEWDEECRQFVTDDGRAPGLMKSTDDRFWFDVAYPIVRAHDEYKDGGSNRFENAMKRLKQCQAGDWRHACEDWIERREKKAMKHG